MGTVFIGGSGVGVADTEGAAGSGVGIGLETRGMGGADGFTGRLGGNSGVAKSFIGKFGGILMSGVKGLVAMFGTFGEEGKDEGVVDPEGGGLNSSAIDDEPRDYS